MKVRRIIAVCLVAAFSSYGAADTLEEQNNQRLVHWLLGGELSYGGDKLARFTYTNGLKEDLRAGGTLAFKAGLLLNVPNSPVSVQATLGYHFDSVNAENVDADFTRYPMDLSLHYNVDRHRIGIGASYHTSVEYELVAVSPSLTERVNFKDSIGAVIDYGYQLNDKLLGGMRYMDIEYQADTLNGIKLDNAQKIDGSHVGIYMLLKL